MAIVKVEEEYKLLDLDSPETIPYINLTLPTRASTEAKVAAHRIAVR